MSKRASNQDNYEFDDALEIEDQDEMRDVDEGVMANGQGKAMNLARKSTESMINLKSIQSKNKSSFNMGRKKSYG